MSHLKFSFIIIFLSLLFYNTSKAQWVPTNGPNGGHIECLFVSGTTLLAGSEEGLFVSINNGTTWTLRLNCYTVAIKAKGTKLFAGTKVNGVWFSTDNGETWNPGGCDNKIIHSLGVHGNSLFAGAQDIILRSDDDGITWTEDVNTGLPLYYTFTQEFAEIGINLFAGLGYKGVFLTTNNGTNWTAAGLPDYKINSLITKGTTLFAGTLSNGIFLSTNNGSDWIAINSGLTSLSVESLLIDGSYLYAGTDDGGVFMSTNNGSNWTKVNVGLTNSPIYSLATIGTNLLAGSWGKGIFLSNNFGMTWNSVGLQITYIRTLLSNGNSVFAGTSDAGVFLTTDNGLSWTDVNNGLTDVLINDLLINGTHLFAGTGQGGVFFSTNNGLNWTAVNNGLTDMWISDLLEDGTNLFAATRINGIFLTTNNGTQWTAVNNGLTDMHVISLFKNGNTLFAGTWNGVFVSTNNGTNWTPVNNNSLGLVTSFAVMGTNLFAGSLNNGVSLSTDNGINWTAVNNGISGFRINKLLTYENKLFAATADDYIHYPTRNLCLSTDNGANWKSIYNADIISLAVKGPNLFVGQRMLGVWMCPLSEITGTDEKVVSTYFLSQNYPNPFNPGTTIKFSIPTSSLVTLKVFDVLGKEVSTLINENKNAGKYEIHFDGSGLTSGVYIYKLQAGNFIESKKLLLLK